MLGPRLAAATTAILWGFTYILTTDMLPHHPALVATIRALGGALFLLALGPALPPAGWMGRMIVLGTLNTGVFFGLFFIGAMRLTGGVAAIFQALGPIMVLLLAWVMLNRRPTTMQFISVIMGLIGVALVVLKSGASIDIIGVIAMVGCVSALSLGGILMNIWGIPPMDFRAFTGWQLLIGGIELAIVTLIVGDYTTSLTTTNIAGFVILAVILTGIPFLLWFRAISRIGAVNVMPFVLLTPVTALVMDAGIKHIIPNLIQMVGVAIVMLALLLNYRASLKSK